MVAKKKATANGNIEARLSALRSDFESLRAAEEVADRAMLLAEEAAREAKVKALEYSEEAQEWAEDNADELRSQVRAQPLASLLIAGGIGAFLGAILLRR